jgi:Mor family transcriptional regulator
VSRATSLTREQALAIRETYRRYRTNSTTLAARYGVSVSTICSVINGTHTTVRDQPNIAGSRTGWGKWSDPLGRSS